MSNPDETGENLDLTPAEQEQRNMALLKQECDNAGAPYPPELREFIARKIRRQ